MEVDGPPVLAGLERVSVHYQQQDDGSFIVRAVDALTFLREHPQLIGARLNLVRTQVRDGGKEPYLVVTPTTGVPQRPRAGGSKKRRVDDRKQLTALGLEAARRDKRPANGGLTRDSILWRLVYGCCGEASCSPKPGRPTGCTLEVRCTATGGQIENGDFIRVEVCNQHSADGSWVPPQPGPDPAKQAELTQTLQTIQTLRVEKTVRETRVANGGAQAMAGIAAGREGDAIHADIARQQSAVKRLREDTRPHHPQEVRDEILRLTADGHGASMTQQLMKTIGSLYYSIFRNRANRSSKYSVLAWQMCPWLTDVAQKTL